MTHILHLDASARPGRAGTDEHGSISRRLTHRFATGWTSRHAHDTVTYRDIGAAPPSFIDQPWIQSAFTPAAQRSSWMAEVLAESDQMVDELIAADILVIGAPLYNFGMPATLKAWVDQVVRLGRTVDYDPSQPEDPFIPLLAERPRHAVILSSRGEGGLGPGGPLAHMNHLEPSLTTVLEFIGITRIHRIAVEHQETGGKLLADSIDAAEHQVDALIAHLAPALHTAEQEEPA
ncbi:FMN-dependent NADH-azoreductase [Halomonas elongata]|uniref:FMN dependent NADH:quinone oxidoreductase n=1 Tax=Halomonas elongata (strain ATCC 33173 / DSM 2581 / NBRC 15536 / NCIMB 2198 / 1H9) TaxID=768066 RepID=E1V7E1_HALED|nr:NAD(P)H-dependent oxidoreductase [Halomonas elongata]MDL4864140.1 NAD(P)H-dependent oxidoreductase [Halomonas elongata]WBF18726.1 NAD(P)H-dependent oxidoreductase [Halomonas elongata]WPU47582.1 NAD(P)H-dependent oxidoreductase [Halomonas elongata DSM 2581]WVI72250.1 NAD(P)H-dependent oxidoreductase [Halomonas elongata]CBV41491.1 FMN-dependent NADH-azoreductase [Halomonas elongata DSM 2581]